MISSRIIKWIPVLLLITGLLLLVYSGIFGETELFFILIIPVISVKGFIGVIGTILLIIGFISIFLVRLHFSGNGLLDHTYHTKTEKKDRAINKNSDFTLIRNSEEGVYRDRKDRAIFSGGGVIFIGPIPIIFGSDSRMGFWMVLLTVVITLIIIGIFLYLIISL